MDLHVTDEMQVEMSQVELSVDGCYIARAPNGALALRRIDARLDPHAQKDMDDLPWRFVRTKLPAYLKPQYRALLCTEERVDVPADTILLICVRSTWARLGLISPPTVADPGFRGQLTMEVFNASSTELRLRPGDAIWSVHKLLTAPGSEPMYKGRYQGQLGIQFPKVLEKGV